MPTVADQIFELIVADILSGSLSPKAEISERSLVARFGASRTPIREALKRLRERGFLTSGPKGVSVVRDMPLEEIKALYSLRLRLEGDAATLVAKQVTGEEIRQLKEINRRFAAAVTRRDLLEMLEVRAKFHSVLAAATRNRWLAEMLIQLRDKAYAVRHWHWQDLARARETIQLHEEIIQVLRLRDAVGYRRLVQKQIRGALDHYVDRPIARPSRGVLAPSLRKPRIVAAAKKRKSRSQSR